MERVRTYSRRRERDTFGSERHRHNLGGVKPDERNEKAENESDLREDWNLMCLITVSPLAFLIPSLANKK